MLHCSTSRLLQRRGRVVDIRWKGPRFSPHPGHGDFLRVRDRCVRTLINHSQDLGLSRLRSIVHKTWAYQDSNKSSQVIGISVLRLIIRKTWAYQFRHNQSFARLGLIKIPINHSQDFGISDSDQLFTRLGHIKTLINHSQDLGISKHMPIKSRICQSCQ